MAETTPTTPRTTSRATAPTTLLRAVQALAVLAVLNLLYQFVTAGNLLPRGGGELVDVHGSGAIVLHVLTGLLTVATGLYWRLAGAPLWPAVLSAVVFVLTFVQAAVGDYDTMWIHVPGALVLTVGTVWVLAWSFTRGALVRR